MGGSGSSGSSTGDTHAFVRCGWLLALLLAPAATAGCDRRVVLGLLAPTADGPSSADAASADAASCAPDGGGRGLVADCPRTTMGRGPTSLVAADFDGDALPDLAVTDYDSHIITVLRGAGPSTLYTVALAPAAIVAAHVQPGVDAARVDLAVANFGSASVTVLLGRADGVFAHQRDHAVPAGPLALCAADLDGDGRDDLAVASQDAGTITLLRGGGGLGVADVPALIVAAVPRATALACARLRGSSLPVDLVVADEAGMVRTLVGDGHGGFTLGGSYPIGARIDALAVGDLDRDGALDVIAAGRAPGMLTVLLGRGDGTLAPRPTRSDAGGPRGLALADLDGDGQLDLAVAHAAAGTLAVLLGRGDGGFLPAVELAAGHEPYAVAPLAAGARPDLAVADHGHAIDPDDPGAVLLFRNHY